LRSIIHNRVVLLKTHPLYPMTSTECTVVSAGHITTFFIGFCLPVFTYFGYTSYQKYKGLQNNLAMLNTLTYINCVISTVGQIINFVNSEDQHARTRSTIHNHILNSNNSNNNLHNIVRRLQPEPVIHNNNDNQ
jgi:hypothetical protein